MGRDHGFVAVHGGRLYYEVEGEGPFVLFVHAGVANLRQWEHQVASLAEDHSVVRYDTRGFGKSESEEVAFSNRADLIAVLDHVGARQATVVGASRGGLISLDAALEYPDRVAALVSVAGGVGGYQPTASSLSDADWAEAERHWEASDWGWLADFETALWVDGPGQPEDRVAPGVRAVVHDWVLSNYRADKESGLPQPLDPPPPGRLDEVQMPVLVVVGELDEAGTVESCRHLAERVSGARLEEFEGVAHMVNLEAPDRFDAVLRAFLDEHGL